MPAKPNSSWPDRETLGRGIAMKALFYVACVAACVPRGGTGGNGTVDQSEAQNAGKALGAGIEGAAAAFGPVSSGAGVDANCVTLSGDTSDPDGDSIPN